MKSDLDGVAIRVRGLIKKYGDVTALDGVSFDVGRGEVFAFVGPNGAGKTTTVEILECLREPTAGEASVLGFSVKDRQGKKEIRRRVGVLPQDFNTFDLLTVRENIEFFASMYGVKVNPDELIELVKLEDKRNALYKHLSGGLQKRLGIAISLVNDPEVVFLDEPTTGLDPRARRDVWDIIEMLREEGKTVFLTTHYMEEAERLADEAAIINYGRVVAKASPDELIKQHGGSRTLVVRGGGQEVYNLLYPTLPEVAMGSNGDVLVTLENKRDLTDVALALSGEKTEFEELIIKRPTMEDVFLNLTGKKIVEGELL